MILFYITGLAEQILQDLFFYYLDITFFKALYTLYKLLIIIDRR